MSTASPALSAAADPAPLPSIRRPAALVTGASAGIGNEFARQLAALGYDVVLVARDRERLAAAAAALQRAHGGAHEVLPADLASPDDVDRVVARIDAGGIDLLVNNAGFGTKGSLARTDRGAQERMLHVHVLATHRLTQAAVQSMVARGNGAVITVSSVASFLTSQGNVNYCATKAYQRIYMQGLAQELAARGVYVQALCPGFTRTEFHGRAAIDDSRYPRWMWLSAERVVRESLAAMRRQSPTVVIPGRRYRAVVAVLRATPMWVWRRATSLYRRDGGASRATP